MSVVVTGLTKEKTGSWNKRLLHHAVLDIKKTLDIKLPQGISLKYGKRSKIFLYCSEIPQKMKF